MSADNIDYYPLELDLDLNRDKGIEDSKTKIRSSLPSTRQHIPIAVVTPSRRKPGSEAHPIIVIGEEAHPIVTGSEADPIIID